MSSTTPPSGTILTVMTRAAASKRRQKSTEEIAVRKRILEAAFEAFIKSGYAAASTLEIANRARVSKRELYSLVGNKLQMLIACVAERSTQRLTVPAELPVPRNRETLGQLLAAFGAQLLRDASDQHLLLVADQCIELALGNARAARDLERAGRRIAALHERLEGRLENALPYRAFLARFLPSF